MKWFLGFVLVIALIAGALYGVGHFFLPNTLEVGRSISIERPRATVFAMTNDLRIVKEWSPYYALDPDAAYAFSGEGPGAGQTMRWVSQVRQVGQGRMSIVRSQENEEIESIVSLSDRATLNMLMRLEPTAGATNVNWSVSAECSTGAVNVPCRYMNLILRGMIVRDLDAALARLKTLAEQLPNVDFEGANIEIVQVPPQDVLFVDVTIAKDSPPTFEDREAAERDGLAQLNAFLASSTVEVVQPRPIVRVFPATNGADGRYTFSVGVPYVGPAPIRLIGIRAGRTPGGEAIRLAYTGPRAQLGVMYQKADAFMRAHRIVPRQNVEAWEIGLGAEEVAAAPAPAPDASSPATPDLAPPPPAPVVIERTEIYYPIGEAPARQAAMR